MYTETIGIVHTLPVATVMERIADYPGPNARKILHPDIQDSKKGVCLIESDDDTVLVQISILIPSKLTAGYYHTVYPDYDVYYRLSQAEYMIMVIAGVHISDDMVNKTQIAVNALGY